MKKTLEDLASVSEVDKCDECKALKIKIASVASQIKPEKNGISEVRSYATVVKEHIYITLV